MEDIIDLSLTSLDDDSVLESVIFTTNNIENYDKLKLENSLFCEILEKCLSLENSEGMLSIINNKLLVSYNEADKTYKTSSEFQRILRKTLSQLNNSPRQRCTHIQFLCKMLTSSIVKKKVQLITLDNNIKERRYPKLSLKRTNNINSSCTKILKKEDNELTRDVIAVEENENNCNINDVRAIHNEKDDKDQINVNNVEIKNENKLLVPMKTVEYNTSESLKADAIKKIERKIAMCKNRISKLDEQEVCSDSIESPYIKSEKLKAKIVLLYQELCELNEEEPVRRRQVCIKSMEGHPPGPLKRLETFLNDNTESDGNPPFPNFRDVVKCVLLANKEDNLGWGKAQVMNEARALFTYCGRALQKRRQKREYEDLLSKVDVCEDDPADLDPELLAKLEANRQIGIKRELEVLQKFTMMQNSSPDQMEFEDIYSDSDPNETSPNVSAHTNSTELNDSKDVNMNEDNVLNGDSRELNCIKIKEEPADNVADMLNELGGQASAGNEHPLFVIQIMDSSDEESEINNVK